MDRIEKTVFISYRRTNFPWALAIFQNLTQNGYDVFFDYEGVASGDFESVIIGNINARAHFLVVLTPSALDRCDEPGDWLRREIETALTRERNIVPLMLEGFSFNTPSIAGHLTGLLSVLKDYNGLSIPPEYFMQAMEKLRTKYLNVPLTSVLHPPSLHAQRAASEQKIAADAAPPVHQRELTAQQWFERGFAASDRDDQLRFYTEAIKLNPDYASAFYNRALTRGEKGDSAGAIEDYTAALRIKPDLADAFYNRASERGDKGDAAGAIADYTEAIQLRPNDADAFYSRGVEHSNLGNEEHAIDDYTRAIELQPYHLDALYNRALLRRDKGSNADAIVDFQKFLEGGGSDAANVEEMMRELKIARP